jgi:hypothetical protein
MDEGHRELVERIEELEQALERLAQRQGGVGRVRSFLRERPWLGAAIGTTVLLVPLAAYASTLSVPHTFVNGTTADADEVNANFSAIESAVNDNDGRITTLESAPTPGDITGVSAGSGLSGGGFSGNVSLSVDPTVTQSRVSGTCPAGSSIRVISQSGAVTCETDDVGAGGGGDITDVNAGSGLTGGGSSGSVTLSIASNGVTSTHIQDGTIIGSDILPTTSATLGGLTVNGTSAVNGNASVSGVLDVSEIHVNNSNAYLRFYDSAGTSEFARIFSQSSDKYFYDFGQGRYVFRSNSNGLGIGTSPSVGAAVTMQSLQVTGTTSVGRTRVSSVYALTGAGACSSAGNLTCYYGAGTAVCPAGTQVLGGGALGGSARFGAIGYSYPNGDDRWTCGTSYDSPANHTCWAVCARLD